MASEPAAGDQVAVLAFKYERLRATVPPSPRRTAQLEDIVREARNLVRVQVFSPLDAVGIFQSGLEERRIVALGLMEADLRLADFASVLQAITGSLSAFEHYHALTVANLLVASLGPTERAELQAALATPSMANLGDTSRSDLANRLIERLRS